MSQHDVRHDFRQNDLRSQVDIFQDRDVQIGAAVGLIVGLLIGWFALGWWLAPVQWVDAHPSDLHPEWKEQYVAMVVDSYVLTGDTQAAEARLAGFESEPLGRTLGQVQARYERLEALRQARGAQQLADQLGVTLVEPDETSPPAATAATAAQTQVAEEPTAETDTEAAAGSVSPDGFPVWAQVCGLALVAMLIIVAGVGGVIWYQRRTALQFAGEEGTQEKPAGPQGEPLIGSMTVGERAQIRYTDEGPSYEQSIQIYRGGEIVGSCGLRGVSTLSENGHVVACAAWLYEPKEPDRAPDTRILVSRRVYANEALRSSLTDNRDPSALVPAEPEQTVRLEHKTLEMMLRVVDIEYVDQTEQYIRRLIVELEPVRKRQGPDEPAAPLDIG